MVTPTAMQYAHQHGLAIDHLSQLQTDLEFAQELLSRKLGTINLKDDDPYSDTSRTLAIDANTLEEKIQLTATGSRQLQEAISTPSVGIGLNNPKLWHPYLPDHKLRERLKVSEPILTLGGGDVLRDVRDVKRGLRLDDILEDLRLDWQDENAQLSPCESADFNTSMIDGESSLESVKEQLRKERIQITIPTARRLGNIWLDEVTRSDIEAVMEEDLKSTKKRQGDVLMIITSSQAADVDDPEDVSITGDCEQHSNRYQLTTEKSVQRREDSCSSVEGLENEKALTEVVAPLSASKRLISTSLNNGDSNQGLANRPAKRSRSHSSDDLLTSRIQKISKSDAEIEGPRVDSGFRFGDLNLLPCSKIKEEECGDCFSTPGSSQSFNNELIKLSEDVATGAERELSANKPCVNAIIQKVNIRELSMSVTDVRDNEGRLDPSALIEDFIAQAKTTGSNLATSRAVNWVPFHPPHNQDFLLEKILSPDPGIIGVDRSTREVIDSSQLLWKEQGLRILDEKTSCDVQDIELESNEDTSRRYVKVVDSDLVRYTDENAAARGPFSIPLVNNHGSSHRPPPTAARFGDNSDKESIRSTDMKPIVYRPTPREGHQKSAQPSECVVGSLSSFLTLRGRSIPPKGILRLSSSNNIAVGECEDDPIQSTQNSNMATPTEYPLLSGNHSNADARVDLDTDARLPKLHPLETNTTIIVNNAALQSGLVSTRFLQERGENKLLVIYRDFDQHEIAPDIMLHPTASLIVTNIQALSQRPLPGQQTHSASLQHQRCLRLTQQFDVVFVLIMMQQAQSGSLTLADILVMTEFEAFCSVLKTQHSTVVKTIWMPYRKADMRRHAVYAWTWSVIQKYAFSEHDMAGLSRPIIFRQVETTWELFLRQIGMNTIAAQIVLDMLKMEEEARTMYGHSSVEQQAHRPSPCGLARFVQMNHRERERVFSQFVGAKAIAAVRSPFDGLPEKSEDGISIHVPSP